MEKLHEVCSRHYTSSGDTLDNVLDSVSWQNRKVEMKNLSGEIVFAGTVSFPGFWSDNAVNITASKYFYRGDKYFENSLADLIKRVTYRMGELLYKKYPDLKKHDKTAKDKMYNIFTSELGYILLYQISAFNSPVYFNLGIEAKIKSKHPETCSACFLVDIDDNMESIKEFGDIEFDIFRSGSGSGGNFSKLRGSVETIKGGGISSGPINFMRMFNAQAGEIRSGGRLRRAAIMRILDCDHPDINDFITSKVIEENKAKALVNAGFTGGIDGVAYSTVAFQNENHSVGVTNEFMNAVIDNKDFPLKYRKNLALDGTDVHSYVSAKHMMHTIAECAWDCGDPGLQFKDTINDWNTIPNSNKIETSNACSEIFNISDTSCNLASINLIKFLNKNDNISFDKLVHVIDIMVIAQDLLIDYTDYPHDRIKLQTSNTRNIGLGITNLGNLFMLLGIPYDSDEARYIATAIMGTITSEAYNVSRIIGSVTSAFPFFKDNIVPMSNVLSKHAKYLLSRIIPPTVNNPDLVHVIKECTKEMKIRATRLQLLAKNIANFNDEIAHCYVTAIAPAGTISFMMDATTTGVEPELALIKYKRLVGGDTIEIINNSVKSALSILKYNEDQVDEILNYVLENKTIEGAPYVSKEHYKVFQCSIGQSDVLLIQPYGHLRMVAALQPVVSQGISKTINVSEKTTVQEIKDLYISAWKMGLKCISIYRDGSKNAQPLTTSIDKDKDNKKNITTAPVTNVMIKPYRKSMPETRQSITHKFSIVGHEGYLTVGLYEDGQPGEIFIIMAKIGSFASGIVDCFATSVSLGLQYGVPLKHLIKKFKRTIFEPSGITQNQDIQFTSSVVDYIGKFLEQKFVTSENDNDMQKKQNKNHKPQSVPVINNENTDYNICSQCGALLVYSGTCKACPSCGATTGCS